MIARRERERMARPRGLNASAAFGRPHGRRPDGNEQLTTVTGAILIVLLAVIGFTIPQLRQFIWLHLFVGLLLIGPVAAQDGEYRLPVLPLLHRQRRRTGARDRPSSSCA